MDSTKKVMDDLIEISQSDSLDYEQLIEAHFHNLTPAERKAQLLEAYNTCCICGGDLQFTHVTNFVEQTTVEEAHCPSCNIRNKKQAHRLQ